MAWPPPLLGASPPEGGPSEALRATVKETNREDIFILSGWLVFYDLIYIRNMDFSNRHTPCLANLTRPLQLQLQVPDT